MHNLMMLAAAAPENPIQEISRTFGFNTHHFVAQVISFCLVAFLLQRFAYKPILKVLEERRQKIAEGIYRGIESYLKSTNSFAGNLSPAGRTATSAPDHSGQ